MSISINGTNGLTFNDGSSQQTAASGFGFKNRLINSAMMIDQRNAGASVTPTSGNYLVDRYFYGASQASKFTAQQNAGAVTPPLGFTSYLGFTSSSAYAALATDRFRFGQPIEGLNVSDLGWGTANAQAVTLSFWVRSSLTGPFGASVGNASGNRSYPFAYTINSANTWEYKTVTIPGDTTGTWLTTNGIGILLQFNLGSGSNYLGTASTWAAADYVAPTGATSVVGTNGATFYITGVQLEKGSTATSFDYRPYGTELALCQRYYFKIKDQSGYATLTCGSATVADGVVPFPVEMRVAPSSLEQSGTASDYQLWAGSQVACSSVPVASSATKVGGLLRATVASGLTAGGSRLLSAASANAYLAWSAEL